MAVTIISETINGHASLAEQAYCNAFTLDQRSDEVDSTLQYLASTYSVVVGSYQIPK